jgi:hypothetical protein
MQAMQAITELVQDDPYLKMTPKERLVEFKRRRSNFFGQNRLHVMPVPPVNPTSDVIDPAIKKWINERPEKFANPWHHVMWFFDLVIAAERPANALPRRHFPRIEDIQKAVGKAFDVSPADIRSSRRTLDVARPRQVAYLICKRLTPFSLPQIGARFNGRDHTTILHGLRKIERLRKEDEELDTLISEIEAELLRNMR